jgi:hypothetical protein
MTAKKGARYDWAAVERDYRTGQYSNRELTRLHGPSEGAIRKRATDHSWQRDLSEQIRQRVREKTTLAVTKEVARADSDELIIEQAAEAGAEVIRGHQRLLRKSKGLAETLMQRLEEQLEKGTMTVQLKSGDVIDIDVPLDYAGKTLGNATMALERVVKMERQSYGLDAEDKDSIGKTLKELLAEVAPGVEE